MVRSRNPVSCFFASVGIAINETATIPKTSNHFTLFRAIRTSHLQARNCNMSSIKPSKPFHRESVKWLLVLGMVAVSFIAIPTEAKKQETGFLDRTITVAGTAYKYQVFVPDDWTKQKKWPVILFLHGAGERGDDGLIQTEVGIGTAIRRYRDRFPAVVVMPQCRRNVWWSEPTLAAMGMPLLAAAP